MLVKSRFSVGVYNENRPFTPSKVAIFIASSSEAPFVDAKKVKALISKSQAELSQVIGKYNLGMDQELQFRTSAAGKELAELVNQHDEGVCNLIQQGGASRGCLI